MALNNEAPMEMQGRGEATQQQQTGGIWENGKLFICDKKPLRLLLGFRLSQGGPLALIKSHFPLKLSHVVGAQSLMGI